MEELDLVLLFALAMVMILYVKLENGGSKLAKHISMWKKILIKFLYSYNYTFHHGIERHHQKLLHSPEHILKMVVQ